MRHYFFLSIDFRCVYFIITNPFALCFAQLRDGPNLKAGTGSVLRRQLNTQGRLRIGTILWTHGLLPFITSVPTHLPSSCAISRLRRKRVSANLVHVDLLGYILLLKSVFFIFFYFLGMMKKFNQSMYARMRAKKNEPLSNLGAKNVKVMDKGASITPTTLVTLGIETARMASPATSVEEILPQRKR